MLNSRDIGLLRGDVAANCRRLIARAAEEGYPVLVTGTVRDKAYQLWCYENGYSRGKTPTFHAVEAGLAFDVCKNVRGEEYSDEGFWRAVGRIGRALGFTWGGDWKSFTDKPHFQWDDGGRYTGRMILAGNYPPAMPAGEEDEEMTQAEFDRRMDDYLARLGQKAPGAWSAAARAWAEQTGLIAGDDGGARQYKAFLTREQLAEILFRLSKKN